MATVAAALFSTSSTRGLKFAQSEHQFAFDAQLRVRCCSVGRSSSSKAGLRLPSLPLFCGGSDSIFSGVLLRRPAMRRIAAAVAQEEAVEAVAAETEEEKKAVESAAEVKEAAEGEEELGEGGESQVNTKLYFGNLPYHCDSAQLAGIVQQYGNPELVEVLYNKDTGRSRGFGFVTMSTIEDANAVIENLDGSEYAGRFMRVNFADKPKEKEPLYPETEHKLFIGNLSWSATSDSLYDVFQQCGNVVGARVIYDGDTGRSRGYGFVCFATRSEMENALATLDGVELEGRPMRVNIAQGRKS